jgi:hypothetical protein
MWLPQQLAPQAETLKKLGLALDPTQLGDPQKAPLGAVVSLGGCSASFVSADGLIVTNHHCATGALQYNSSPEKNLMKTGFLAKTRAEEKWAGPTARVYVTRGFTDVTDVVRKDLEAIKDDRERDLAIEKRQNELVAECEKKPSSRCEVASYFGGGQYLLIDKLEIKDVRLVYAPAEGVGNFGGEIDNWRWPRHSGDFSLLRAYVAPDQKPADHAEQNVPFQPAMHLTLAREPLRAGDLVFVAGYPGRTMRLYTAGETAEAVEWFYPKRIRLFEDYLALIERLGKDAPTLAIKARPLERGLANALTYTKGALEGLTKGGAADLRRRADAELASWIASDPARKQKLGEVFPKLEAINTRRAQRRELDFSLWEIDRLVGLVHAANTIVRMAEERPKPDADRKADYQERNWERLEQEQQAFEKRYERKLDSGLLALALTRVAHGSDEASKVALLPIFTGKKQPSDEEIRASVDRLYAGTKLEPEKTRVELLKKGKTATLRASRDPMIRVAVALRPLMKQRDDAAEAEEGAFALVRPLYVGAIRDHAGRPVAPDANGTLRVTYGTVRGYQPKPGAPLFSPFTTLPEVAKKATGEEPFAAPQKLVELSQADRAGPYADAALGTVPVDFLSDCDITGGNSGSPTLDAHGNLVGLAFDGNYEAMASDWVFMPAITRAIHVDIRYMLWVMDAVDGADTLLREMGVTPTM